MKVQILKGRKFENTVLFLKLLAFGTMYILNVS